MAKKWADSLESESSLASSNLLQPQQLLSILFAPCSNWPWNVCCSFLFISWILLPVNLPLAEFPTEINWGLKGKKSQLRALEYTLQLLSLSITKCFKSFLTMYYLNINSSGEKELNLGSIYKIFVTLTSITPWLKQYPSTCAGTLQICKWMKASVIHKILNLYNLYLVPEISFLEVCIQMNKEWHFTASILDKFGGHF